MVSFPIAKLNSLLENLSAIVFESNVSEIKWKKIKTAKYRFAAQKVMDLIIEEAIESGLRIDVVIWDTEDSRHKIVGRDDNENLRWMYFQLFRNVLHRRWPLSSNWCLYPDENSIINWERIHSRLNTASMYIELENEELALEQTSLLVDTEKVDGLFVQQIKGFSVSQILAVNSTNILLAQVADLFVGVGVFSHQQYNVYYNWVLKNSPQMNLGFFENTKESFTSKEDEHCFIVNYLNVNCKQSKLGVSLESTKGFFTYNPANPINFWLYQPQGSYDKAPLRNRG